jgi:Golgi nucleoside diphosphatase
MENKNIIFVRSDDSVYAVDMDDFSKVDFVCELRHINAKYIDLIIGSPLLYNNVNVNVSVLSKLIYCVDELPQSMQNTHMRELMKTFEELVNSGITVLALSNNDFLYKGGKGNV